MSSLALTGVLTDENGKKYKFSLEEIIAQQPPVVDPPQVEPPPSQASGIPLSYEDSRFKRTIVARSTTMQRGESLSDKTITDTGQVASVICMGDNTLDTIRIKSREGVRLAGRGKVTIRNSYIEVNGTGDDHADGVQAYAPGVTKAVLEIRNSLIKCGTDAATAGLFIADNYTGTMDFENVVFWGGPFGSRICSDVGGDNIIRFKNIYYVGPFGYQRFLFENVGGHKNIFDPAKGGLWENVREATIVNGKLVPGNAIPRPF